MHYQNLRGEVQSLAQKINELEAEHHEHGLVVDAIKPLDPDRKCFRMIGGVLVEGTTGKVLPVIEKNRDQLEGLIKQLAEQLQKKEQEAADFAVKHKIVKRTDQPESRGGKKVEDDDSAEKTSAGVLV